MSDPLAFRASLLFVYAVILIWQSSTVMRRNKTVSDFLPFFIYGILLNALAALVYYEMRSTVLWVWLDVGFSICHIWILASLTFKIRKI